MQKRLRNDEVKSVMAEMGSKGGKIGGKRRAANMSPEQRRASASLAARTRWSGKKLELETAESKREAGLRKIAAILEEQMTSMGLSEEEKNAKTAELVAFVSDAVSEKLVPHATQSKQPHTEARRA
jgi:hypothetical protein